MLVKASGVTYNVHIVLDEMAGTVSAALCMCTGHPLSFLVSLCSFFKMFHMNRVEGPCTPYLLASFVYIAQVQAKS